MLIETDVLGSGFLVSAVEKKCVLKNNKCFFWVSAVVLPGVFFFVFDR